MPNATIVMVAWSPTKERLNIMKRCFQSLLQNTHYLHKLIVIDHGPEEQTEWLKGQCIDIHHIHGGNQPIGDARNLGARMTNTKWIAFVDNDMWFFPNWLKRCIVALQTFDQYKLIATQFFSHHMQYDGFHVGTLKGGYRLYKRSSPGSMVIRREDYEAIGPWSYRTDTGGNYSNRACKLGYYWLWHPTWTGKHMGTKPTYNWRCEMIDGHWVRSKWWKKDIRRVQWKRNNRRVTNGV